MDQGAAQLVALPHAAHAAWQVVLELEAKLVAGEFGLPRGRGVLLGVPVGRGLFLGLASGGDRGAAAGTQGDASVNVWHLPPAPQ